MCNIYDAELLSGEQYSEHSLPAFFPRKPCAPSLPQAAIFGRLTSPDARSFAHLFSESDDGFLAELQSQTVPARRAGFSKWESDAIPPVSIGWSWFIHCDFERMMLPSDGVRSNVMLVDSTATISAWRRPLGCLVPG
jgi:hypothetical protein